MLLTTDISAGSEQQHICQATGREILEPNSQVHRNKENSKEQQKSRREQKD